MSSLDYLFSRSLLKTGVVNSSGTDTPVAIRLRYIGTGTVTSVIVTTATDITMITSDGGTDAYLFATYTTVGAVIDAINADGIFEAKPLDCLRALASASKLVATTISSGTYEGITVWDVLVDTSTALQIGTSLTFSRGFDHPQVKQHRLHLQQVVYAVNMGTAAVNSVQFWKRKGTVETQLLGLLSVDTTETTITFASGLGYITAAEGEELIVLVLDAATLADATGNFVRVVGLVE